MASPVERSHYMLTINLCYTHIFVYWRWHSQVINKLIRKNTGHCLDGMNSLFSCFEQRNKTSKRNKRTHSIQHGKPNHILQLIKTKQQDDGQQDSWSALNMRWFLQVALTSDQVAGQGKTICSFLPWHSGATSVHQDLAAGRCQGHPEVPGGRRD